MNRLVGMGLKGLVTNNGEGGGATKREWGVYVKFYPNKKGRGGNSFSHSEEGAQQVLG